VRAREVTSDFLVGGKDQPQQAPGGRLHVIQSPQLAPCTWHTGNRDQPPLTVTLDFQGSRREAGVVFGGPSLPA
jgi:hypothetical protein